MDNLDDKKLKFINAYFKYQNVNDICKALKITRQTYYNYYNDYEIKDAINKQRLEILQGITLNLQTNLKLCSDELIKMIKSDDIPQQTKLNAINSVFNNCNKLTEQVDILNEIQTIEQRLSEQENKTNGGN